MALIIAIILTFLSVWLIWHITKNTKLIFIHLLLLLVTPWFLTLVLSRPSLVPLPPSQSLYERFSANLSYLTSDDFLFFRGDGRPDYGTSDHGVFLLSFLPPILMGVYYLAKSQKPKAKLPFWWLLSGLTIAVVFGHVAGLPAGLWYLPSLSILATLGFKRILNIFTTNKNPLVKTLIVANFLWLTYEILRLYHVIIIHQPFTK